MSKKSNNLIFLIAAIGLLFFALPAEGSSTNGAIDSSRKYVWGENTGWINFGATQGAVRVTDSALTGYAWSDDYGWINLDPANSGVSNNGEGTLTGYAWNSALGWVNFNGVVINTNGKFTGQASGSSTGIINFDCANCDVTTDWRPRRARPECNNAGDDDGDGQIDYPADVGCGDLDDDDERSFGAVIIVPSIQPAPSPVVQAPSAVPPESSAPVAQETAAPAPASAAEQPQRPSLIQRIQRVVQPLLTDIFTPSGPEPEIPIERLVPKIPPIAMQGEWNLAPREEVNNFVFAPLAKEFLALGEKFPNVQNVFNQLGIIGMADINRLREVQLQLPGLTRAVGLVSPELSGAPFPQGIPLEAMFPDMKSRIPTEVVFVRGAGELVDLGMTVQVSPQGKPELKINTISNKKLHLVVRTEKLTKRVRGYIVFRSKPAQAKGRAVPLASLFFSLALIEPVFAHPHEGPVEIEERLVLAEFEYTDPDGDGIYTADIQAPVAAGEYEIITVMDYQNPELGSKEIRLITVVDPEGYIYEKVRDQELRLSNSVVTLFWLNTSERRYEPWPAKNFGQANPQLTGSRGSYSFLVPEGMYYLQVEAPGYQTYVGKPFEVKEGGGVHFNIAMKSAGWRLKALDWRTALLVALVGLLAINFYRDRKRK